MNLFNQEFMLISEKYSDVLQDMENVKREYEEYLEKDVDITLNKVKEKDLPDDINASFLEKIKFMID